MSPSPQDEDLSTPALARLLGTETSTDLQAIDALTQWDRQWCVKEARQGPDRRLLLGAIRLKWRHSLKPRYAQSHLTDLESWESFAASRPVALGLGIFPEHYNVHSKDAEGREVVARIKASECTEEALRTAQWKPRLESQEPA